ncbi:hypothetical protein JCGZ_00178 [Jatropha curcas]|uniref:Aminotransferase-like plant mobile domain-containing protein n=1 Tax=Jatropha curcas TaxID=180498 RepID=A0A067JJV3_JATCU|nr:hypothetical protein JCGZ_00178 [Jatropha curcas]
MTSPSHSSDEDFLASLGVSLEDADVTRTLALTPPIPFSIRSIELYDDWRTELSSDRIVELIGIDLPRVVEPGSITPALSVSRRCGTYDFWEIWAFEYFPYTRPELLHIDLGLGLVPMAWRWYRTNLHTVRCKKSLKELRAFFNTCTLEQVCA